MIDTAGLEVLSRGESLKLLTSVPVGRIAFTDRALPAIQPVNFVVDGETIVFRTGSGSKLAAATRESIVAFQADEFDADAQSGWSVMGVGRAYQVTDDIEIARLCELPIRPWTPAARDHFVRIELATITGRRIPAI